MTSLRGNCQRCKNYDLYLRKVDGRWLCRRCRDEQRKFSQPKIPTWKVLDPFKNLKRKLLEFKKEIKKKRRQR